jgi:enoyl-CoA hydratase/carnithine racemase
VGTPLPETTAVRYAQADGVAVVTLDRPEVGNAFDAAMLADMEAVWRHVRADPDVRAVVLTGAGDRAFCTGIDRSAIPEEDFDPYTYDDPGRLLGPKSRGVWKPVVAAVNGMACGGAFYLLGEADVVIASSTATFFDPHVTYGMTAVFEPLLLLARMPFGEVLRMALMGAAERMSAETARAAGLVSEVVEPDALADAAHRVAAVIAAQPAAAVQATLRTVWAARDLAPQQATDLGNVFLALGTSAEALAEGNRRFASGQRQEWRLR